MSSILKVSEIQDPTNGNSALTIDSSGNVTAPQNLISPGHILQTTVVSSGTNVSTSSTSYQTIWSDQSITMIGNNKLLVMVFLTGLKFANSDARMTLKYFQDGTGTIEMFRDAGYTLSDVRYPAAAACQSATLTAGQTYTINAKYASVNGGTVEINSPFNDAGQSTMIIQEIAQ